MAAISIGNVMPSLAAIRRGKGGDAKYVAAKTILDLAYRDCALIMEQSGLVFSAMATFPLPLPILGFSFDTPEEITFAKYTYATYPYLNKAVVANSFIKEVCPLRVKALRPIQKGNPVMENILINQVAIRNYIERYADRGGLFGLNTMWGYVSNLALTEFKGVKAGESHVGGVGFEFSFERLNFGSISKADKIAGSLIKALG